jgi:hypothetical protein
MPDGDSLILGQNNTHSQTNSVVVEQDKRTDARIGHFYADSDRQADTINRSIEEDQAETEALIASQNQRMAAVQEWMANVDFPGPTGRPIRRTGNS